MTIDVAFVLRLGKISGILISRISVWRVILDAVVEVVELWKSERWSLAGGLPSSL